MPEQDSRHQTAILPRIPFAMMLLLGAAFSALVAAIGFAVVNVSWIGNFGLLLALLLVADAMLVIRYGLSFFALKEHGHSWFYDFNYELEQVGAENVSQDIRRELERKKHARYITSAGVLLPCLYLSIPIITVSVVLIGYGGLRCMQHYKILVQQFSDLLQEPET